MNFEKLMIIAYLIIPLFLTGVSTMEKSSGQKGQPPLINTALVDEQDDKPDLYSQAFQSQHVGQDKQVIHAAGGSSTKEQFGPHTSSSSGLGRITKQQLEDYEKYLMDGQQHMAGGSAMQPIVGSGGSERQMADNQSGGFTSHLPSGSKTGGKGQHPPIMSNALNTAYLHNIQQQQQKRKAANVLEPTQHKKAAMGEGSRRSQGMHAAAAHQPHSQQPLQINQKNPQIQATG